MRVFNSLFRCGCSFNVSRCLVLKSNSDFCQVKPQVNVKYSRAYAYVGTFALQSKCDGT